MWADGSLQDCHAEDRGWPLSELLGHVWNGMYVCDVRRYVITCAVNANASCNSLIWFSIVHESNKACIDMAVLCQAVLVGWTPPEVNAAYL